MTLTMTVRGADHRIRFDWHAAAGAWTGRSRDLALPALRIAAPVSKSIDPRKPKGGRLRESITGRIQLGGPTATVLLYSTVPYARFVIGGTRPHPIVAKNAPRLAWVDADGWHYAIAVHHPGTKPNPFPHRALMPLQPALAELFAKAVKEATL